MNKINLIYIFMLIKFCECLTVDKRIKNGEDVDIMEFPHVVAIEKLIGFKLKFYIGIWKYTCVGSIIEDQWILTAKRCTPSGHYRIYAGKTFLPKFYVDPNDLRNVDSYWLSNNLDLALLRLEEPVVWGLTIRKITFTSRDEVYPNQNGIIVGWGENIENGERSGSLKMANVVIERCLNTPESSTFCSRGINDAGGCSLDYGSGLITGNSKNGTPSLAGVLSDTEDLKIRENCNINTYVRVTRAIEWIEDILLGNS